MPDRLLLRLSPAGEPTWLRQAADARAPATQTRGWPPASAIAAAAEIVVLVPAEDVLLTEARIAAKSRAQLAKAVPYAVEDQLLAPVEELAFATSEGAGGAVGVAVVAKSTLRAWLERLAGAGIRPDALLPESLALPAARATALVESDRAIVRLAPWSAFACAPSDLAEWSAFAGSEPTLEIHDFREPRAGAPLAGVRAMSAERGHDPLGLLARGLGTPPLNLLEGEFAPQHRAARGARWWRIAAALAAAVLVLAVANLSLEVVQLSRASSRVDAQTSEAVRKAFPDVDDAELARVAPADLARSRIERLRGGEGSGLLRVLAEIAPVLGSTTRIQTRGMEFRNGALELGLRAPDVATLDAVRERLAALPGIKVAVTAANPGDGGIDGRIRIDGAAR